MNPPKPNPPDPSWEHYNLWIAVQESILALPGHFKTKTIIDGLLATDIFTLNQALAATIEEQVVSTLNGMRALWDPEKKYTSYYFVRQSQTFPDVILRRKTNGKDILMGIELKGWYLLAKEGMPNFRFTISKNACTQHDLIAVVPWALSNVLSGYPIVFPPYIDLAYYAAEQRNYYWQEERQAKNDKNIILAENISPYPSKSDKIADKPVSDAGNNFGRLARYGTMNSYIKDMLKEELRGIPVHEWLTFLKKFKD